MPAIEISQLSPPVATHGTHVVIRALTDGSTATSYHVLVDMDDESADWEEVRRLSLSNAELLELAERFPAPAEWLGEEW